LAQPTIQASFNSGEWAPHLYARTDLEKYHSGAALLRNWFVDYRGGASTRVGTKYCLRGYKDSTAIRMITFQASFAVKFACEFGDQYIRFYTNGGPVLEAGLAITGVTQANPAVVSVTNTYTTGDVDWVYISGVGGMTQLNGNYYKVHAAAGGAITLYDLFGNPVDSSAYGAWTAGGTVARVFTLTSPYAAADLALLKFVQNVNTMIFCHPSYVPYALTYATPTSWTFAPIVFGTTVSSPTNPVAVTTFGAGASFNTAYAVTAIDGNGQESELSVLAQVTSNDYWPAVNGTMTVRWDPVVGAASYNVYKAVYVLNNPVVVGAPLGFIGNTTATSLADSNIAADFSQPPPTRNNPFATGAKVTTVVVTVPGSYTVAPTSTFTAAPAGGVTAIGVPILGVITAAISAGGTAAYVVGDTITLPDGVILTVATLGGASPNTVATVTITNVGAATSLPANPVAQIASSGAGTGASFTLHWGVTSITMTNAGTGYVSPPTITFSTGAAAATATLGPASVGDPSVPAFFQQRLALAAPNSKPQTVYFSQPGNYYNFDISIPIQDDDSITASIVSGQLNNIKAMIPQPGGLITLTDGASFLLNGGSLGSAITPASITANAQSFLGCNDMPPIVVNYDILYVQSKGASVRDASYNFYANVFTGSDISVLSSHLFFGHKLLEWAWAEEPYKIVWAVRNDGILLSLTFIKEQEFIGWAHHDTLGSFKSVCSVVEAASVGFQNFIYTAVGRTITIGSGGGTWSGTWSPTLKSNMTLSNGNLTATIASAAPGAVISVASYTTGVHYAEVATDANFTQGYVPGANNDEVGFINLLNPGGFVVFGDGEIWRTDVLGNVVDTGINLGSCASSVINLAIDCDHATAWIAANGGDWNGSPGADPATNTGGLDCSGWFTPGVTPVYLEYQANTSGAAVTASFSGPFVNSNPFGSTTPIQYIEQFQERATTGQVKDYWTVDCGLQYNGAPATTFFGAQHLAGFHCTGLADGIIIPDFVMPATGTFTLPSASKVTVGLAYTSELQTLYIDMGQPTIQSKDKKIPRVTLRVTETLGLKIGSDSNNIVDMKDLIRGQVGQNTNIVVTDLVTGDATTTIDPKWQEAGQIYVRQPYPYPASILGVMQDITVGDTAK
jgi:hypothetical protein